MVQKDTVLAVIECKTDVMAMLKTSGGKSMLATIPTLMSTNTGTVVVLPLKSLVTDWRRKLDSMEIVYQEYQGGQLDLGTNLVWFLLTGQCLVDGIRASQS